jgi:uroporphyrinogen decarboxylase
VVGREFEKLTPAEQEEALHENAEIMVSVSRELGFSGLTFPADYWEVAPGVPSYFWLPPEARLQQVRILHETAGRDLLLIGSSGGVMGMPGAHEYEEVSCKLFDAPEEIDERARGILQWGLDNARRLQDVGMAGAMTAADIADNHGPYYSPPHMARFILPYLRSWSAEMRRMGLYAIMHTDGMIDPILEDLACSGLHALQAIDPVAGMDMVRAQRQVGERLCLCGNVDCGLLQFGPPEKIYESTKSLLQACKSGGRFVLGASNAVFQQMPIENYRAMVQAWRDYGKYD